MTTLTIFSILALLNSPWALSEKTLFIDTYQQEQVDKSALIEWFSSQQCDMKVALQKDIPTSKDFVYSIFETQSPPEQTLLLIGKNRAQHPLRATWIVHESTGMTSLKSLKNERAAVQVTTSLIGYIDPMQQMMEAGIQPDDLKLYPTDSYEGAIALLLHGDVTTAAIPLPLAIPWAKANDLTILSEGNKRYQSAIWSNNGSQLDPACQQALLTIKKDNRRDKKMAVFPEWLEGFTLP